MSDFRKIEAFCKVCEQRSFSRAGEALFLSQPTVSAHIQSLEREYETRLLDRMGRTVLPTPAGAILYRHARQAFSCLEAAKAEISALAHEIAGDLRIGSSSIPAHHILPDILSEFIDRHAKVRLNLAVDDSSALVRQVLDGTLMAAIVGGCPADPDLETRPLLDSEIVIIAPRDMDGLPLLPASNGDLPEIGFADACRLPWIFREYDSTTRKAFEEVLRLAGHDARLIRPKLVVDSSHAAIQYVRAGLGVNASARVAVKDHLARRDIQAFVIQGIRPVRRFSCITNARRAAFPAASAFLDFLHEKTVALRLGDGPCAAPRAADGRTEVGA